MSSFLKSALQLHKTERPVLPADGDIPGVPEEAWVTLGVWQDTQHQAHTTATAPASQMRAERDTHEDFSGFAADGQTSNALAEHQSHLQFYRAVWKHTRVWQGSRRGKWSYLPLWAL